MKKSTKLLMTTLLVSLGLAACGGNSTSTSTSGNQQSLTITTFGELATLDSADYDDVSELRYVRANFRRIISCRLKTIKV